MQFLTDPGGMAGWRTNWLTGNWWGKAFVWATEENWGMISGLAGTEFMTEEVIFRLKTLK